TYSVLSSRIQFSRFVRPPAVGDRRKGGGVHHGGVVKGHCDHLSGLDDQRGSSPRCPQNLHFVQGESDFSRLKIKFWLYIFTQAFIDLSRDYVLRVQAHRDFVQTQDEYIGGHEAEESGQPLHSRAYLGPVEHDWDMTTYGNYVTICTEHLPKYFASSIQLVLRDPNLLVLKFPRSHLRSIIFGAVTDLAATLHPSNYSELIYQPDTPRMDFLKEVYRSAYNLFIIPSPPPPPPPPFYHKTAAQRKQRLPHGPDPQELELSDNLDIPDYEDPDGPLVFVAPTQAHIDKDFKKGAADFLLPLLRINKLFVEARDDADQRTQGRGRVRQCKPFSPIPSHGFGVRHIGITNTAVAIMQGDKTFWWYISTDGVSLSIQCKRPVSDKSGDQKLTSFATLAEMLEKTLITVPPLTFGDREAFRKGVAAARSLLVPSPLSFTIQPSTRTPRDPNPLDQAPPAHVVTHCPPALPGEEVPASQDKVEEDEDKAIDELCLPATEYFDHDLPLARMAHPHLVLDVFNDRKFDVRELSMHQYRKEAGFQQAARLLNKLKCRLPHQAFTHAAPSSASDLSPSTPTRHCQAAFPAYRKKQKALNNMVTRLLPKGGFPTK
ncbi:hypothetical protein BDK51DRAFT_30246, partial [Blyttiomyces helicus]